MDLPDLPEPLTSFGAAATEDAIYVYGGHTGAAHSYSTAEQSNRLLRLDLRAPDAWQEVSVGPRLQGLALVSHGSVLYRIGGFSARNAQGAEHDLWSQDEVARFDPATASWLPLPRLPEPRSSHDAAALGGQLYVVGGWQLRGSDQPRCWHETAWTLDVTDPRASWQPLAGPPLVRRALALAEHESRLYAIGGMRRRDGPTTRVDVFTPATGQWSRGPDLPGEPITGFGAAACATGGSLYVSTTEGHLLRLAGDGSRWEIVRKLGVPRFFHQMVEIAVGRLAILGGAHMQMGKFATVEVIQLGD